jgi:hypothetical protein
MVALVARHRGIKRLAVKMLVGVDEESLVSSMLPLLGDLAQLELVGGEAAAAPAAPTAPASPAPVAGASALRCLPPRVP